MTLLSSALKGIITPEMEQVAAGEGVTPEFVRQGLGTWFKSPPFRPVMRQSANGFWPVVEIRAYIRPIYGQKA